MAKKKAAKKSEATAPQPEQPIDANLKYILSVRPGSAAGTPLRYEVKGPDLYQGGMIDKPLTDLVNYAINQEYPTRPMQLAAAAIQKATQGKHGYTANNKAVVGTTISRDLFILAKEQQVKYMALDVIVAAEQTGGLGNLETYLSRPKYS
jgi:hypothetical protein